MKYLITKAHITLNKECDSIEKAKEELAESLEIKTSDIHLNYEEIKEEE